MKKKRIPALLLGVILLTNSPWGVYAAEGTWTAAQAIKAMGENQEGAFAVRLTNSTGKRIRSLSVSVDEGEFAPSLLDAEDPWEDGEVRFLYVTPAEKKEDGTGSAYDLRVTFTDNTVTELHSFPFTDTSKAELLLEEDVLYLTYVSDEDQTEKSTLEKEKNLAAGITEETGAPVSEQVTTDAAAQSSSSETVYETVSESTYEEPAYTYDYSESYSYDYSDSYSSGGGDACLDDGISLN